MLFKIRKVGNGMNDFVKDRMKRCGIPTTGELDIREFKTWEKDLFKKFILHETNLLIIGEFNYSAVIKLMKLKLIENIGQDMMWVNQSILTDDFIANFNKDTLALIQLFEETVEYRKRFAGALVSNVLSYGGKIIIGCTNPKILGKVFPYDLDTIENNFEIWKV